MHFPFLLSVPFSFLALATITSAAPGSSTFTLTLSPDGFNPALAELAKRDPGMCEDTCPAGSPRVANCAYAYNSAPPSCFCAGNGLQCKGGKLRSSLVLF